MSVKAMTWVFDHSPYTLATRLVHLAIADIANDSNDCLIWIPQAALAKKAMVDARTVRDAMAVMVRDGYLEVVDAPAGKAKTYRFLTPENISEVDTGTPENHNRGPRKNGDSHRLLTQVELKGNASSEISESDPVSALDMHDRVAKLRAAMKPFKVPA